MKKRIRWQWHSGNRADLLVDGQAYFPQMLAAVDNARDYLLLEFYYVSSGTLLDTFIEALCAAAQRGVRVYLLVDAIGSRDMRWNDSHKLQMAGVNLQVYNPIRLSKGHYNFHRDHRKMLVADGSLLFTGGTGITDEFDQGSMAGPPWHEVMVRVEGPVVSDWCKLFKQQWYRVCKQRLALPVANAVKGGDIPMRLATTHGWRRQRIKASFRQQLRSTEHRVWLVTAYFLPSFSVRRALIRAARRGVEVGIIVPQAANSDHPGLYYASRRYYRRLLEAGVRIYEYQPRFIHAKLALCDDWVSLGSCNLDHWNLHWNLEANQEMLSAPFAQQVLALIEQDVADCEEITLQGWMQRPWHLRLKDYCLGALNSWLLKRV